MGQRSSQVSNRNTYTQQKETLKSPAFHIRVSNYVFLLIFRHSDDPAELCFSPWPSPLGLYEPRGKQIFCKYQVVNRWDSGDHTFSITTTPSQSTEAAKGNMWISVCCCVPIKLYSWTIKSELHIIFMSQKQVFPPNLLQIIRPFIWKAPTSSKIITKTTWFTSFILLIPAITIHLTVCMQKN